MGADHERPFQFILGSHSCQCGMVGLQLHPHVPPSGTPVRHTQCGCRSSFQDVTVCVMSCQHEAIKQTTPRIEKVQAGLRKRSKPAGGYLLFSKQSRTSPSWLQEELCHSSLPLRRHWLVGQGTLDGSLFNSRAEQPVGSQQHQQVSTRLMESQVQLTSGPLWKRTHLGMFLNLISHFTLQALGFLYLISHFTLQADGFLNLISYFTLQAVSASGDIGRRLAMPLPKLTSIDHESMELR